MFGERKSGNAVAKLLTICRAAGTPARERGQLRGDEVPVTFRMGFGRVC